MTTVPTSAPMTTSAPVTTVPTTAPMTTSASVTTVATTAPTTTSAPVTTLPTTAPITTSASVTTVAAETTRTPTSAPTSVPTPSPTGGTLVFTAEAVDGWVCFNEAAKDKLETDHPMMGLPTINTWEDVVALMAVNYWINHQFFQGPEYEVYACSAPV